VPLRFLGPEAHHRATAQRPARGDGSYALRKRAERTAGRLARGDRRRRNARRANIDTTLLNEHLLHLSSIPGFRLSPREPAADADAVRVMLAAPSVVYFLCHGEYDALEGAAVSRDRPGATAIRRIRSTCIRWRVG